MNSLQVILISLVTAATDATEFCAKSFVYPPSNEVLITSSQEFLRGSTSFSLSLLRALNHSTNTFFSPFSIWSTLVLVYVGAQGLTEKELSGVLGLQNVDKILVAHTYRAFQRWFHARKTSSSPSFNVLNKLFVQSGIALRHCVLEFTAQDLVFVDFQKNPENARRAINMWVRSNTNGKISEILPPFTVHKDTELVVTSTMYFKAPWLQPFQPQFTGPKPFYVKSLEYVLVDTMTTRNTFLHAVSEELQCSAVELPYYTRSVSMVVMLPNNKGHGVNILANSLTPDRLEALNEDMFPAEVVVQLPKFHMDSHFQLSSVLHKMGLRNLFGSGLANLTGFSAEANLEISEVFHKAYISVDEQGTEAAASTSSAVSRSSRPKRVLRFVVDRPFVFYIRENHSGAVLFLGVVFHPEFPVHQHSYSTDVSDSSSKKSPSARRIYEKSWNT